MLLTALNRDKATTMATILGLGGVFFKYPDPDGKKVELWQPPKNTPQQ